MKHLVAKHVGLTRDRHTQTQEVYPSISYFTNLQEGEILSRKKPQEFLEHRTGI